MIDIRQLELFVAVAEELHFGRAANRIGMAQPPFSQQIRRLEQRIGAALLERTSRRVSLTPAGAALLQEARDLITRRDSMIDRVRRTATGDAGTLRIGFAASSVIGILPIVVRQVRIKLPGVVLHIDDRDAIDFSAAIRGGLLDAAIVRAPILARGLKVETIHSEPFVAVLPDAHPLARREHVAPAELAGSPFILFPRSASPGLHDTIVGLCVEAGFSPVIVQEVSAWMSVAGLVESGLGITIAPASAARMCPLGVRLVPFTDTNARAELALIHNGDDMSPLASRFRDIVTAAVSEG